ncbi:GNAT family N-acetyltransferase [bacterium]|nr:GNAT family N-acetyltransferase [bacterium]
MSSASADVSTDFLRIDRWEEFPAWATRERIADYFHETMVPYEDPIEDVKRSMDYAFEPGAGQGGFLALAHRDENLLGACLMLRTGMKGYIPEWLLLMVTVDPETRGQGVGRKLIDFCLNEADGDVKLHVEYQNPAKRLYERIGFTTKYADMRYNK